MQHLLQYRSPCAEREVVLGVDARRALVAAAVSLLGKILAPSPFRRRRPAIICCSSGLASGDGAPGWCWRAPAPLAGACPNACSLNTSRCSKWTGPTAGPAGCWGSRTRSTGRPPASCAQRSSPGRGEIRRRSGTPGIQIRQRLRGQGSYPGDQPAQGRSGPSRPRAARTAVQPGRPRTVPPAHASACATTGATRMRWPRPGGRVRQWPECGRRQRLRRVTPGAGAVMATAGRRRSPPRR